MGAAWYRRLPAGEPGYGFVADDVPEVAIAVAPDRRGQGIGGRLLAALFESARASGERALSLSVSAQNPVALRLYEQAGFVRVAGTDDHPTMLLSLASADDVPVTRDADPASQRTRDRLYHFSEDPSITRFVPHVPKTAPANEPLVWAIDDEHADLYYFPRDCPRVTFHRAPATTAEDHERFLGLTTARRVAAIETAWLRRMREAILFRYVLPGGAFSTRDANAGYWVSHQPVEPLAIEPVGDLMSALAEANVELRIMPSLWPLYEAVVASTLGFSIIRWHNTQPQPEIAVGP